ncbi:MAG TPA: hypothetical protein VKR54_01380 [Candidatus Babeliales bacterium]|jgi:hypothetical protein|nr:hypothetical protein [Candidatus Babeliales bacterium]
MKKITCLLTLTMLLCNALSTLAMQSQKQPKTNLVIIPGQDEFEGQNIDTVLPYFADKIKLKHYVEPLSLPDLGQERCIRRLATTMSSFKKKHPVIIHASGQGTATAINYASENPQRIKALILDSIMLTGNSAITHTIDHEILPGVTDIPGSYYVLPYIAKVNFPFYGPADKQPIFNADKLPENLPIILIHHTDNPQLSYKDAQALYAFLKKTKKNKNVYLLSRTTDNAGHIYLYGEPQKDEITVINTILKKHTVLPSNPQESVKAIDITPFQPDPEQEWLDHFNTLLKKEEKIWYMDWAVNITLLSLILTRNWAIKMTLAGIVLTQFFPI